MDAYRAINEILVHLFNEIWELEEKAVITDEYKDITNNDMHIIEAVGLGKGNNMTAIAKKLKITVGSLTTSMNSLVNKKYVVRERSAEDRRVVNIRLTKKGGEGIPTPCGFPPENDGCGRFCPSGRRNSGTRKNTGQPFCLF